MRRLFQEFISALREKPFSYKIAYCENMELSEFDPARLRALYDRTDYLMGRIVIADSIRRLDLKVPNTFLRHMVQTGNRYVLKDLLLMMQRRQSLRTLVRTVKHPLCQDDSLIRHLTIKAARAQGVDPRLLDIYINTEQQDISDEEAEAWRLWRPLDRLIMEANDHHDEPPDTLRLMLWENRPLLAEELARDLSDIFNVPWDEMRHINVRRLGGLLAKYIDLSYLLCQALAEGDFGPLEDRLAREDLTLPPGVLVPSPESDLPTRGGNESTGGSLDRGGVHGDDEDEVFPEEHFIGGEAPGESSGPPPGIIEGAPADLTVDDLVFEPEWAQWLPRSLAEELLVIPLHIDGSPPVKMHIGCALGDHAAVAHRLAHLGCQIIVSAVPEKVVREAIRRFY